MFIKPKNVEKKGKFLTRLGRLYDVSIAVGSSSGDDYILWYYLGKGWSVNEVC